MAYKAANSTGGGQEFWDSVSSTFASNDHVFYELYNEPHNNPTDRWMNGDSTYAGMLEMAAAVRKNSPDQMLVIGGGNGYAYDTESLIELDGKINDDLVLFNFHPYMGPYQAGDASKSADGFESIVQTI